MRRSPSKARTDGSDSRLGARQATIRDIPVASPPNRFDPVRHETLRRLGHPRGGDKVISDPSDTAG